jgi:hypothetical protein
VKTGSDKVLIDTGAKLREAKAVALRGAKPLRGSNQGDLSPFALSARYFSVGRRQLICNHYLKTDLRNTLSDNVFECGNKLSGI